MSDDLKIKTAAGKVQLNMMALRALKGCNRVFTFGGKKYKIGNFLLATMADGAGSRYMGALLRHMADLQGLDGQFTPESLANLDPESGLPHIDHMLCGLIMLRAIMIKDGVLAEDPGEGLEPPVTKPTSVKEFMQMARDAGHDAFGLCQDSEGPFANEQKFADARVKQGNYDVIPFAGEYGGVVEGAHPVADAVFRGREVDDWFDDVPRVDPLGPANSSGAV